MAPPFLTTLARHRDPRLLWPVAALASVVAHGVALAMVRTLAIQTPTLPEGTMAPLPIQMVTLSPDLPPPSDQDNPAAPSDAAPRDSMAAESPPPVAAPTSEPDAPPMPRPPLERPIAPTSPQVAAPPVNRPLVAPASQPSPAPVAPAPPAVTPAPARPAPEAIAPETVTPPASAPPTAPPATAPPTAPAPGGATGQGGQVVPVGIRLNPSGRDIPETAPQLLGATAIDMQPLASGCGFANLDALLTGMVATSVQLQIRVETSGEISQVRPLQGSGSGAVDDLVSCVVRQRLRLQPASSAGVAQLTDAFILEARIQF